MSRAPRSQAAKRWWGDDDSATPILHVDMDAFFAEVELLDHPELRGRPLIIGGRNGRGVVSAATYEARAYGVNSAMSMARAMRLCPTATVLPVRHERYVEVSRQVMEVLGRVTPQLERVSVDEAFLDVSGARRRLGSPVSIARQIRRDIREQLGLPASVGVASTMVVAKLASQHAKPDGLLLIPADRTQDFLSMLPVGALWGVGAASERALARWGITDVRDLAQMDVRQVERIVGQAHGRHLWNLAHGIDPRAVTPEREMKSVGTEQTFYETVTDPEDARRILLDQCHQCAARLRSHEMLAGVVVIKVRGADFHTVTRSRTLTDPTDVARDLWETVQEVWRKVPAPAGGYRLIGVRCEGLRSVHDGVQLAFDDDPRRGIPERVADDARRRWGKTLLTPASLLPSPTATEGEGRGAGPRQSTQ